MLRGESERGCVWHSNHLILQHLIRHGFYEPAVHFAAEACFPSKISKALSDKSSFCQLYRRSKIRRLIWKGKVDLAELEIISLDDSILPSCPELQFHLRKQRFVEMCRESKVEEAIEFAQEKLAPLVQNYEAKTSLADSSLRKELEEAMALLVFDGAKDAPVFEQKKSQLRRMVATEVNEHILRHFKVKTRTSVELLLKEFALRTELPKESSGGVTQAPTLLCHGPPNQELAWRPFSSVKYSLRSSKN